MAISRRNFILGGLGLAAIAASGGTYSYLQRPKFGRAPSGDRLARMQASPHYADGQFHNLVPTQVMTNEGEHDNRVVATWKFLFGDKKGLVPDEPMISKKTDLFALNPQEDVVVWMGHSSFYMQLAGKRILIDPVFSKFAAPVSFVNEAFAGSNIYTADDIPDVDLLVMSHDHWDHLDYPTVMSLKNKIHNIVCPLGVGEYFEQWGFPLSMIYEGDWNDAFEIFPNFMVHVLTSQHFSGRLLKQNPTLWGSFAFITPQKKVYYTGDGGYGDHFKEIGKKFGGFDLVIAEDGQYNLNWHQIHMLPEEVAQAMTDVGAKLVLPAHNSKFALARHIWQEPMRRLEAASADKSYKLLTPEIGELAHIDAEHPDTFDDWWERMS